MNWIGGMIEKLPIVGDKMKEVNDRNREAIELERERQAIVKQERVNEIQNAKDALSVAELRVKAKDKELYTAEQRLAFIKEANRLEEEQSQRNVEIAERKLEALRIESSWAENNAEANAKLAKLEAEVYNARREYFDRTQRLKQNEMTLINEVNAERKAEVDAAKQAAEQMKAIRNAEIAEIRKAEDEMLKLVKDDREQQTRLIKLQYNRQIEDLKKKLTDEKNLTKAAREAINSQILSLEQQRENALEKQSQDALTKELNNRAKLLSLQLESVAKGSEQEYQLKMNSILAQRDMELANKELTEQMKLAITEKYNTQMDKLSLARNNELLTKQQEAMRIAFETEIAQSYGNQQEILRIKMEQKLAELEALQQMEGESMEAFNLRRLRKENEYMDAKQDVADKEIAIEQAKYAAMNDITNGLIALTEQLGESDRGLAIASKMLALAQIAINTGLAISKMITAESGKGIVGVATMAAGIGSILSNVASAVSIVKSAKFAEGGYVSGPGSGTSDSIPAMLSNGESVLNAQSTSMFGPILSSLNMMGGGVPINTQASSNQTLGEDMLARAVAKGMMMAPAPVVSIEEFTSVANRVKYVEQLGSV